MGIAGVLLFNKGDNGGIRVELVVVVAVVVVMAAAGIGMEICGAFWEVEGCSGASSSLGDPSLPYSEDRVLGGEPGFVQTVR